MRAVRLLSLPVLAAGGMLLLGFARSASRAADDKAIVAALDTKYQAAVKANDADGMGAILAEDFILVTGTPPAHVRWADAPRRSAQSAAPAVSA